MECGAGRPGRDRGAELPDRRGALRGAPAGAPPRRELPAAADRQRPPARLPQRPSDSRLRGGALRMARIRGPPRVGCASSLAAWTKSPARMPRAWAVRNSFQAGPLRRGCGADPGVVQDLPHRGGGDLVAELNELALHAPVPPARIVGCHADHELADRGCRGRPSGTPPAGVVPFAVTSRRCQASSVAGVTVKISPHRCRGTSQDSAASHSRSPGW